jgi:hypothetical protein
MITSLQQRPVIVGKQQSGSNVSQRTSGNPNTTKTEFQKLFQPAIATGHTSTTANSPTTHAASPPAVKSADTQTSAPIPIPPITDLHDQTQVEAHMNAWLENVTQNANDQKMQIYQQAMTDWQTNCQRCQDLGLPAPPQPTTPNLDPVQPMPAGWWFQT